MLSLKQDLRDKTHCGVDNIHPDKIKTMSLSHLIHELSKILIRNVLPNTETDVLPNTETIQCSLKNTKTRGFN